MTVSTVRLAEISTDAQSGFASGKSDPGGVLQVRMNNVTTDGSWDWSKERRVPTSEKQLAKYALRDGDVLVNVTNSPNLVGKTACFSGANEPVVFSNHFVRLRLDENRADARFVRRWMNLLWKRRTFEGLCTQWVNQASVRKEDLLALRVPLPPLPEQRRIAAILDKADAVRRKRQQTLDLADQFLRSAFLDLFGDPVTNPVGWDRLKLSDAVDLVNGRAFKSSEWSDRGKPIIRIQNLKDRSAPYNYFAGECSESFNVESGDLLLAWAGQLVSFGVHIWDGPAGLLNQHIFNVRPRVPFELEYLEFALGQVVELAKTGFHGIEMKHLTKANLNRQQVLRPPEELQKRFAAQVRKLRASIRRLQSAGAGLYCLAGSLTQRAFRGEL